MIDTVDLSVWGRSFSLPVEYDCYTGESVTKEQKKALELFITHQEWITKSKKDVVMYCEKRVLGDEENKKKDSIFSYVLPETIFVKRDNANPRIALMCKYRYDPEHGIAIVFSSEGEITVGEQDIIL